VHAVTHDLAEILQEAIVHGFVVDDDGNYALVVGRRRPFMPFGTDPRKVNAECARRYAVTYTDCGPCIREVNADDVRSFLEAAK
jgi:hypothetical protein